MKKTFIFLLVFILLFSIGVSAAENESLVSVSNDDNALVVYTVDSISSDSGYVFGMTKSDFKDYMKANNIVVYGTDADNTFVFNLSCTKTSFSTEISDFYDLSDEAILSFADDFVNNKDGVVSVNGVKYVVSESQKENNGVVFSVYQYITVRNSNLYVLTFNIPNDKVNDTVPSKLDDVLSRLSIIREQNLVDNGRKITLIFLVLLIAVIAAVAVIILFSLVKDIKNKNNN